MNCWPQKFLVFMLIVESTFSNQTEIASTAKRFQQILSRKKRYLLFPPGSAVIATFSYTKTLVPRSPSGINMIGEFDVSYPLQTTISDWFPPTKKPTTPEPEYYEDDEDDANNGNTNIMINPMIPNPSPPQSQPQPQPQPQFQYQPMPQTFDIYSQTPSSASIFVRPSPSSDSLSSTENPITNNFTPKLPNSVLEPNGILTSDPNYNNGRHPGEIYVRNNKKPSKKRQQIFGNRKSTDYTIAENTKYSPTNWMNENELLQYRNYEWHPPKLLSQNKMNERKKLRWRRFTKKMTTKTIKMNIAKEKQRKHAKERRDLYQQLQSLPILAHIDSKSCILRIICESKHYLLPAGVSLFQDIIRILFTLPYEFDDIEDDYILAMKSQESHCRTVYSVKCPYSVLGYLLSSDRPIL